MDKSEALLIAYALENDLEDYAGQSLPRISQDIADSAAVELRRLHAENERLTAQRDALLEALKNILPFVATQAIGCHGYKCREQWCWSCYGEEDAEEAASQALVLAKEASRIIKEVEETK